jgi:hypothetical protein
MAWVSICVIALFASQVGGIKMEPTPAVRPSATEAPRYESPSSSVEREPNLLSSPREGVSHDSPTDFAPRGRSNEIPSAAEMEAGDMAPREIQKSDELKTTETPKASESPKNPAAEMVAASLQIPPGSDLQGQPWPLAQALAASPDRKQQLLIVHGYWQLAEAVAKYHFAFEQQKQIEPLQARPADDAALSAAKTAAKATLRDAELAVISAQNDLASLLQLPPESALPLPNDKPHVGGYRTSYQDLFGTRTPPAIARVIDRTLPIRLTAIKDRAASVQAANDAWLAAADSYRSGQADFGTVISSGEQLLHEQRAMIETVCRYNHDIAEYAFAVLGTNISAQQLVGALIETDRGATAAPTEKRGEIQPVEYQQPIHLQGQMNPKQLSPGQPTPELRPIQNPPPLRRTAEKTIQANKDPFSNNPNLYDSGVKERNLERENTLPSGQNSRRADAPGTNASSSALYPALFDAEPEVRAKQLTLALHWDRRLPENSAKPMTLSECLARETSGNRREMLAVYWTARQCAAENQAIAQELEFLEMLASDALERRNEPAGATEMLYLRAARLSAKASLDESQAALIESQYELAMRTQSTAEATWPLASTPPRSEKFDSNAASQSRQVAASRPMLRMIAAIPAQNASVQDHATAVVEADAARAGAVDRYLAGAAPLGPALGAIRKQTRQTFAYLQTLTDYNRSIADFALTVLPADATAEKLASTLVAQQ